MSRWRSVFQDDGLAHTVRLVLDEINDMATGTKQGAKAAAARSRTDTRETRRWAIGKQDWRCRR